MQEKVGMTSEKNKNGEVYPLRFTLQKQQQAECDNRHTDYDAYDSDFAFLVLPRHREQLFERYEHHNSRDRTKQHAENCVVKERAQQQIPDNRAERLGNAREKRYPKRLAPTARRIINRHGGGDAFGYVMYCYGDRNRDAEVRILEGGCEGGETFGEIMYAYCKRGHKAHAL